MKLIFAQGNPGTQYERTRHNAGMIALLTLANQHNASWKLEAKLKAHIAKVTIASETILLAAPTTFYNETGQSARAIVDFYKLSPATDVLVLHDELALPLGTVRVRNQASDAGNNGIKSLNSHLGKEYWRIKIGIYEERPAGMSDADFVLSTFNAAALDKIRDVVQDIVTPLTTSFAVGEIQAHSERLTKLDSQV